MPHAVVVSCVCWAGCNTHPRALMSHALVIRSVCRAMRRVEMHHILDSLYMHGPHVSMFMQLPYASVRLSASPGIEMQALMSHALVVSSVCRAVWRVEMRHVLDSLHLHGPHVSMFMQLPYASVRSSPSPGACGSRQLCVSGGMQHTSSRTDVTCIGRQFCLPGGAACRDATRPRLTVHAWDTYIHLHATAIRIRPFVSLAGYRDVTHVLRHKCHM
nr:MAG: hypothetical protein [Penaeus monodon endogenous nimavirus]